MRTKNIKINAVLNVIRTSLSIVFPLVTYPYILRVLNADGIGKVSYVSSIVSYFAMLAMLGVSSYAVREGAKLRDNKENFSEFASQVFSINIICTIISYALLFCAVLFIDKFESYRLIFLILSFSIVFQVFSIDWVNSIFEDFAYITIRTIIIYMVNIGILFLFVKKPDDYIIYAIATVAPSGIVCLLNWIYCRKYVSIHLTTHICLNRHLKPLLILFANAVAISIYVNIDVTMLGWFKGDYHAGVYAVSAKVYNVCKNVLASIYAVTVPRLASYIGQKDYLRYKQLYSKTWGIISIVIIPASVGMMCFSQEIIIAFGGNEYLDAVMPLQLLSVALIFAIFGGLVTACLNITIGKEKINMMATIIAAITNFLLNLAFIPLWGATGAAITTAISEFVVLLICFIKIENRSMYLDRTIILKNILHCVIGSVLIFVYSSFMKIIITGTVLRMIIIIPTAIAIYALFLLVVRNQLFIETLHQVGHTLKIYSRKK